MRMKLEVYDYENLGTTYYAWQLTGRGLFITKRGYISKKQATIAAEKFARSRNILIK